LQESYSKCPGKDIGIHHLRQEQLLSISVALLISISKNLAAKGFDLHLFNQSIVGIQILKL